MSTESAANLTRSIIQVDAFIPAETEAVVRLSAEQTGTDLQVEENLLHVRMLRLIATERRRERTGAWAEVRQQSDTDTLPDHTTWNQAWNADWTFTDERREHVLRQYPLQVRAAGRSVMTMVTGQQIDFGGVPLRTPAGRAVKLMPFRHIVSGHTDEPHLLARHLRLSGMHTDGRTRRGGSFDNWLYPSEAQNYLKIYPVAPGFGEGEMDRQQMRSFGASDNLLNRIIRERGFYPVARTFEGRGSHEVEGFTGHDVDIINYEVQSLDAIHKDEITVRELLRHLGSQKLGEEALALSGAANNYRRLPGQGRGRCIGLRSTTRVIEAYNWMVTLQPGEAGADELAALFGLDPVHMRTFIANSDRARGRDLYPTAKGPRRRVYPPAVVSQIAARIQDRLRITAEVPEIFPQCQPPRRQIELLWAPSTDEEAQVENWIPPAAPTDDEVALETAAVESAEPVSAPEKAPAAPRPRRRRAVAAAAAGAVAVAEPVPTPVQEPESVAEQAAATTEPEPPQETEKVVEVTEAEEAPEPYEPHEPEWRTYAELAYILRVPVSELSGRIRSARPEPQHIQSRLTTKGDYKPHIHPDVAAEAAYALLHQRHERMPSVQLTVLQISIAVGQHPAEIARRIQEAKITSTNRVSGAGATYGSKDLNNVLGLFGVSF
jgi:hypothetical protein